MSEEKKRCCQRVYVTGGPFRGEPCMHAAKVERGGKWYCGIHDPEKVKAKIAARNARWDEEDRQRAESERAAEAAAAELKRRAEMYDELLAALKACAAVCAGETMHKNGLIEALEKARAVITKATWKGGAK